MAEIKGVLFDLDDTLYPEAEYRDSALRHISNLLAGSVAVRKMLDRFSQDSPYPLTEMVKWLVAEYRCHPPTIRPYPGSLETVSSLRERGVRVGLVTNNATGAQAFKLEALGLAGVFDAVVIADPPELKPSLAPFLKCLDLLRVTPSQSVMVGDDLYSDLMPALSIGMKAVRLERAGQLKGPFPTADGVRVCRRLEEIVLLLESDDWGPTRFARFEKPR